MRWWSYAILAYLTIAVHMALGGFLNVRSAVPNLVLPVAVFVAINAGRREALLGAIILGALQDLFTQSAFGLYALSYGLGALFVVGAQPVVYRDHPLTHFFTAMGMALLTGLIVLLNQWVLSDAGRASAAVMLAGAAYTAALAPFIVGALSRFKRFFVFRQEREFSIART